MTRVRDLEVRVDRLLGRNSMNNRWGRGATRDDRAMRVKLVYVLASAVVGAVLVGMLLVACNPAIARMQGVVTSVRQVDDQTTEVCLRDTEDAGSTYGDKRDRDAICWSGVLDGVEPQMRSCVVLQAQGESSDLRVEPSEDCR